MGEPRGLKRIAQIYTLLEQMRETELRVASGAVREAEHALMNEAEVHDEHAGVERAALILGDRMEWSLGDAGRSASEVRVERLQEIRQVREAAKEEAVDAYQTSRVQLHEIVSVLETARRRRQMETDRRAQAATDDRYLSRREWMRGQRDGECEDVPDA